MTETRTDTPRIYVASLSDYNAGTLHGRWIDATQDADGIRADVEEMLAASPQRNLCLICGEPIEEITWPTKSAHSPMKWGHVENVGTSHAAEPGTVEEWAIHDYDGFHGIELGEWESFETVAELGQLLEEEVATDA